MMPTSALHAASCAAALAVALGGCSKEDASPEREAPEPVAPTESDGAPGLRSAFAWSRGPAVTAFEQLVDANCDPEAIRVNTAVEARILRHTPYAVEGATLDDPALLQFFSSESWFRGPDAPRPGLDEHGLPILPEHERCAKRLEGYEQTLRDAHPSEFPEELEAIVTGQPGIYFSLRELAMIGYARDMTPTRLRHHGASREGHGWVWRLEVIEEPGEEFVTVRCRPEADEWDCELEVDQAR